jgi:hypothetical protein
VVASHLAVRLWPGVFLFFFSFTGLALGRYSHPPPHTHAQHPYLGAWGVALPPPRGTDRQTLWNFRLAELAERLRFVLAETPPEVKVIIRGGY